VPLLKDLRDYLRLEAFTNDKAKKNKKELKRLRDL
jgi:hypothetical protein